MTQVLGIPLGYVMYFCYKLVGNYGVSIILFTLLTKIFMFPLSLVSQKNSIKMVKMQPLLEDIKQRCYGNSALMVEEQKALYKKEKYSTVLGILPLLVQIPIILGLINVIYNPLQHLLRLSPADVAALTQHAAGLLGASVESMGSGAQLKVMELVQASPELFAGLPGVQQILGMDLTFLGLNMAEVPSFASLTILIPLFSGLSAYALSAYQNKHNVLQQQQGFVAKWGMTIFLVAFSAFFAYVLPSGVGLYWIVGNLLSIPVLTLCNKVYDPRKYIDYTMVPSKLVLTAEEKKQQKEENKKKKAKQKIDKKRFAAYKNKQLVIYSESNGYYKYFGRLIDYILENSDIVIHYVTSDLNDKIFSNTHPRIETYYIGPIALIQFMMLMDADMVVMTMPDLENFQIKRSLVRKDIEYVYLDHGMTSFHLMLRKGALDHFDTIFCYGPNHVEEVRETEKYYGLPEKNLVKTGYGLLDTLLEEVEKMGPVKNDPQVILIAPSWQKDNIMEYCLDETLRPLLGLGYKVVVRPHPEFVKRFAAKMQQIKEKYKQELGENFVIETDFSSNTTVYTADLVITDWSSIAQEFSYATKKPSLFINTPMKVMNPEYDKIASVPLDISLRDEIGVSVDVDKLDGLGAVVKELFSRQEWYREHITQVLEHNIYDIGDGARGGGEYIIRTLHEIAALRSKETPASVAETEEELFPKETAQIASAVNMAQEILGNTEYYREAIEAVLLKDAKDVQEAGSTNADYLYSVMKEIEQWQNENRGASNA